MFILYREEDNWISQLRFMIKYTYIKVKGYQAIKKSQHYDDDGAGMNRRR